MPFHHKKKQIEKDEKEAWKICELPRNKRRKIRKLFYEKWIPFQQLRLNPDKIMKKTYRIKTNNQELLIRKQNESDATSKWIEFQKRRPKRLKQTYEFLILKERANRLSILLSCAWRLTVNSWISRHTKGWTLPWKLSRNRMPVYQ